MRSFEVITVKYEVVGIRISEMKYVIGKINNVMLCHLYF
jgi:hypothetical protein